MIAKKAAGLIGNIQATPKWTAAPNDAPIAAHTLAASKNHFRNERATAAV